MSLKTLRAEIRRLTAMAGQQDEVLTILTVVMEDCGPLDYPETVGHVVDCHIQGKHVPLYFPLCSMASTQAAELALAVMLHSRKAEGRALTGLMDMQPFPPLGAWVVEPPPTGVSVSDHAAVLYRQIVENKRLTYEGKS